MLLKLRKAFEAMLGTCTLYLARQASLREAADVLRTDRRTRGEEERSQVHANQCLLQPLKQRCAHLRDVKNDIVITTLQFKQRVSQLLTSYGYVKPGKQYSYLENLLRGMPKRLMRCKQNKYGNCGK